MRVPREKQFTLSITENLFKEAKKMSVKQISVFIENKKGRIATLSKILADNSIDMCALSLADTTDFGILRILVDKPDEAKKVLRENGFVVKTTEVVAISVENVPGGLYKILSKLEEGEVGIEYMYAFVGTKSHEAFGVLKVDDEEKATEILAKMGIKPLEEIK